MANRENQSTTEEDFLESLPPAQRKLVGDYAREHNISPIEAFDELLSEEVKENIADRSGR